MKKEATARRYRISLEDKHRGGIHLLSICGHATYDQMLKTMSKRQLHNLVNWGVLERSPGVWHNGKRNQVFKLSDEGKKDAKMNFHFGAFYTCSSVFHDVHLVDQYLVLSEDDRSRCVTEKQFKNVFTAWCAEDHLTRGQYANQTGKGGTLSLPDFAYRDAAGEWNFVEISNDYKPQKIEAKYRLKELMGAKMNFSEIGKVAARKKGGEHYEESSCSS